MGTNIKEKIEWDAVALMLLGEFWRLGKEDQEIARALAKSRQLHHQSGSTVTFVSPSEVEVKKFKLNQLGLTRTTRPDVFAAAIFEMTRAAQGKIANPKDLAEEGVWWGAYIMSRLRLEYRRVECIFEHRPTMVKCCRPAVQGAYCAGHSSLKYRAPKAAA